MDILSISLGVFSVILLLIVWRLWSLNSTYLSIIDDNEVDIDSLAKEVNDKNIVLENIWNDMQKAKTNLTSNPEMNFYYEKNNKVSEFFNMIDQSMISLEKVYNKLRIGAVPDAKKEQSQ